MAKIDFDAEFERFMGTNQSSAIKDIYEIIPSLSQDQLEIVSMLKFYSRRYNLDDIEEFINMYLASMKGNKNLSFLSSMNMKNLMKAYTMEELVKGIKINSMNNSNNP